MPKDFRTYLLLSFFIHLIAVFFLFYSPAFQTKQVKTYKVTWVRFSKGEWGTNLKASTKNLKRLPDSTIREQKIRQEK